MKKILIPLDNAFDSFDIIDYAIKFFKRDPCKFYFLNSYSFNVTGLDAIHLLHADNDWFEKPKEDSQKKLQEIINKHKTITQNKTHTFQTISKCSNLLDSIKKTISENQIDIVLITAAKRNDSLNYDKTTSQIIEHIRECPVMVIPSQATLNKGQEFILASSFKDPMPLKELKNWFKLLTIAKGDGKLVVLNKRSDINSIQRMNLSNVINRLYILSGTIIPVTYINPIELNKYYSNCILSIAERKPDIWRKLGLKQSEILGLGPLKSTSLIALHS